MKLSLSRISGAGAAPGDGLVYDGQNWKPGAAGGGGATGYALLSVEFGALTSDGITQDPVVITLDSGVGNHGVSVSGGLLIACDPGLYFYYYTLYASFTTNSVSTDVHDILFGDRNHTGIGTGGMGISGTAHFAAPTGLFLGGTVQANCTGGTNRSYDVDPASILITRFDLPT